MSGVGKIPLLGKTRSEGSVLTSQCRHVIKSSYIIYLFVEIEESWKSYFETESIFESSGGKSKNTSFQSCIHPRYYVILYKQFASVQRLNKENCWLSRKSSTNRSKPDTSSLFWFSTTPSASCLLFLKRFSRLSQNLHSIQLTKLSGAHQQRLKYSRSHPSKWIMPISGPQY